MIRVAGLHDQVEAGITDKRRAGLNPSETIDALRARIQPQLERQARMVADELTPGLAEHGIRVIGLDEVPDDQRPALRERFKRQVLPVLTPLAVGLGRPFPYMSNLSLSLAVLVRDPQTGQTVFARVKVPKEMLPRFVPVVQGEETFVLLEDLIADNLVALFPGMQIIDHALFRVTRDADFEISDEADDLLEAVEAELRRRPFGEVVRLEVQEGISTAIREQLVEALRVEERQVYVIPGLLDMNDLWQIAGLPGHPELRDEAWTPVTPPRVMAAEADEHDMFSLIRQGDLLVHHPYESFAASVERFVDAGGRGSGRARGQADRVPHVRRLAARAVADHGDRARQAGGLPRRAEGPLRRAREHPVGAPPRGVRRARRLRDPRDEDARQVPARRAPRGRRRAPLRAHRDRELPPQDRAPVHGLRALHVRRRARRGRGGHVQLPHRLRAAHALPRGPDGAELHARRDHRADRARHRRARGRRACAHQAEDERAGAPARDRVAVRRVDRRGARWT